MLTVHDPVVRDDAAQEVRQPGHQEHRHRGEQNPSGGGGRAKLKVDKREPLLSHLWLFTLWEVRAGVSRQTRPVLRAEVGVQERKAWSDTSLAWMDLFTCSVWCVVTP